MTLVIFEKYSRYWPVTAVVSAVTALLLYLSYLYIDINILAEGYLALAAFCFFAISVFSFFKWRDGRIKIEMQADPDRSLTFRYSLRGKKLAKQQLDLEEIAEVMIGEMPNRSIYDDFASGDRSVMFRRHDGGNWFYMTQVNGRVIPLDEENALRIKEFIRHHLSGDAAQ